MTTRGRWFSPQQINIGGLHNIQSILVSCFCQKQSQMSFDAEFLSMLKDHISLKLYSPLLLNDLLPQYNIAPMVVVECLCVIGDRGAATNLHICLLCGVL